MGLLRKLNRRKSKDCRQSLSTEELVARTQEDRVRKKAKKGGKL